MAACSLTKEGWHGDPGVSWPWYVVICCDAFCRPAYASRCGSGKWMWSHARVECWQSWGSCSNLGSQGPRAKWEKEEGETILKQRMASYGWCRIKDIEISWLWTIFAPDKLRSRPTSQAKGSILWLLVSLLWNVAGWTEVRWLAVSAFGRCALDPRWLLWARISSKAVTREDVKCKPAGNCQSFREWHLSGWRSQLLGLGPQLKDGLRTNITLAWGWLGMGMNLDNEQPAFFMNFPRETICSQWLDS